MNCFNCHKEAKAEFDMVCEQDHGCAPIPITLAMFGALQRTDPRCKNAPVSPEDANALAALDSSSAPTCPRRISKLRWNNRRGLGCCRAVWRN